MIYKLVLPFGKGKENDGKSFFRGEFFIYYDESSYIRDIDVNFIDVKFDLSSTFQAFNDERTWWKFKDELIKTWGLEHISRCPNAGKPKPNNKCTHTLMCIKNKILTLNESQLNDLSDKFNNWRDNNKKITIKGIDGVISGSNATGEVKNPKASSFKMNEGNYKNFATFIKKLWNREEELSSVHKILAKSIKFDEHLNMFPWFKPFYEVIQNSMNEEEKETFNQKTKGLCALSQHIKFTQKLNKIIQKKRTDFKNNMNDVLEKISGFEWSEAKKQKEFKNFERAHIKPVAHIRKQLLLNWTKYKDEKLENLEILEPVYDANNGIWLSPNQHTSFDNGTAYINDDWEFIEDENNLFEINTQYRNEVRLNYIKYHREKVLGKGI